MARWISHVWDDASWDQICGWFGLPVYMGIDKGWVVTNWPMAPYPGAPMESPLPVSPIPVPASAPPEPPSPRPTVATVTPESVAKVTRLVRQPYENRVDLVGEVTAASLRGRARINLPDIGEKDIKFAPEQTKTVTKSLHEHESLRLRVIGRGVFDPYTKELLHISNVSDLIIVTEPESIFYDKNWLIRNTRRIELIDKLLLDSGLNAAEQEELDLLQAEANKIRDDITEAQYSFLDKE